MSDSAALRPPVVYRGPERGHQALAVLTHEGYESRTKIITLEDGTILLHQRLLLDRTVAGLTPMHVHLVLDGTTGDLVSMQTGTTDGDTWTRIRGELARKGLEVD